MQKRRKAETQKRRTGRQIRQQIRKAERWNLADLGRKAAMQAARCKHVGRDRGTDWTRTLVFDSCCHVTATDAAATI